jgi:hypothetical protein
MNQLHEGMVVRLQSRARGTYLAADEDGLGVSLSPHPHRASPNAAWQVRRFNRGSGSYLLLRSAAYGDHLALSPDFRGRRVVQRRDDTPGHPASLWTAVSVWAGGGRFYIALRHIFGLCLRADGTVSGVSADQLHFQCTMMHWAVEVQPSSLTAAVPALPVPTPVSLLLPLPRLNCSTSSWIFLHACFAFW